MRTSRILQTYEAHAEGEPGRVITGGMPLLKGDSVFEKMQDMAANHDEIRLMMLREPRGNPGLCGNVLVPPGHPEADAGFIIFEQTEYPPMSGSNTICVVTVLLEAGILPMVEPVTELVLEAPAGLIRVRADCKNGKVTRVSFRNVPAFAMHLDAEVEVTGLGTVSVDVAWGGMFFVLANADDLGVDLAADNGKEITRVSEAIRHATAEQLPVIHPENPSITGPTITNLWGAPIAKDTHGRGAITLSTSAFDPARPQDASGILDRSPCGTGTCAKMAVLHARGLLAPGQHYVNAGPLGTTFTGRIVEETRVGPYPAIVPTLSGQGWIYGSSSYTLDPSDPFPAGYTVGDMW
ncbi:MULTISPECIES: proline racemase family protein [Rhodobacterales]|jgi:proline racemase|uniref:proline racemase family protein n=1 Tax=Rhodobacterales TaxID=204455 RepID=UPI00237FA3A0|nr:proline racemase family protein [Phaeobacter gallaeciensis]MDE4142036.1 proline racemase family protein [Phaeobacter gallaeciensis]MDE4150481.1 proline racemase family protein [Phaeobacter gallaeciensis]MDE4154676.1 proline racemase family protein [Phaeobacter gallaeciensis]MDE4230067.1 proline racemase family protein [Phaeobacter gallaeciensis]MDE4259174.1 proline racemase family protein [Phaeobacter gallaeciensis]